MKCLEIKQLTKKEYSETYLISDNHTNFKYIVKKGDESIKDEYKAYKRLSELYSSFDLKINNFINSSIPKIYKYFMDGIKHVIVFEYINGLSGYDLDKIEVSTDIKNKEKHKHMWILLLQHIALFVDLLEIVHIQHNDLFLGNIIVNFDYSKNDFNLYIIDMET